jgi:hypothetical protein
MEDIERYTKKTTESYNIIDVAELLSISVVICTIELLTYRLSYLLDTPRKRWQSEIFTFKTSEVLDNIRI